MNQLIEWMRGQPLSVVHSSLRDTGRSVSEKLAAISVLLEKDADESQGIAWLRECITDPNPLVAGRAILALGDLRDKNSIPLLRTSIGHADPYVRSCALIAIGRCKDKSSLLMLAQALSDGNKNVRVAAVKGLGEYGTQAAIDFISGAMAAENDWSNRVLAAAELAHHRSAAGLTVLEEAAAREDDERRPVAAVALIELGCRHGYETAVMILDEDCTSSKRLLLVCLARRLGHNEFIMLEGHAAARDWLISQIESLGE